MSKIFFYLQQFILKLKSYLPDKDDLDWLDGMAFLICVWFFILPYPSFTGLFCVVACIPIIGVLFTIYKGNAINSKTNGAFDKHESEQNISLHIILPPIVLAIRIYMKFDCENYYSLVTHVGIVFLIFGIVFVLTHRNFNGSLKERTRFYGLLVACILCYSYGVTFGINCLFDTSSPERFETRIVGQYSEGGGEYSSVSYHVTVAPWEHHPYKENLRISEEEYKIASNGDYMYLDVQKGLFDIPWYYIAPRKYKSTHE